ncbi:hypothetical protein ZIOFF_009908 [Zingiber officinale]|uniref:Uncharacterized protein n=1 Tax=Zingiber officinale TaxID=94328 RepID=A0A8J5LYY4_ZINOF|nr:hypothetical protein ZIOFF_009908 [Zingiber officinale]
MATSSDIPTTLAGTGPFLRSSSSTRSFSFLRSSGAFYRVGTRGPWWKLALRMSLRSDALVDLVEKQSAEASASALEQFKISADQMLSVPIAMSRVLGTCRVLMAAAKGGSKEASAKAVAKGAMKPKGAFHQKLPLSPAMSKFLGIPEIARVDAVKKSGSTSKQTSSRVVFNVMRTGLFWLCLLGVLVAGMLPHFVMKALIQHFMPIMILIVRVGECLLGVLSSKHCWLYLIKPHVFQDAD